MKKWYNELLIEIISLAEDVIRTSTTSDPFDDDWEDAGVQ